MTTSFSAHRRTPSFRGAWNAVPGTRGFTLGTARSPPKTWRWDKVLRITGYGTSNTRLQKQHY
jgi:hypothetical protein